MAIVQPFPKHFEGEINWMGTKTAPAAVALDATPVSIAAADNNRIGVVVQNTGSVDVFLGIDNTVDNTNGIKLAAGQIMTDGGNGGSVDAWFACTSGAAGEVRVFTVK